jgi:SNF2 family DNA or RNA helicase
MEVKMGKPWSPEEVEYFDSNWGKKSLQEIARKLGKKVKTTDAWRLRNGYETNTKSHHGIPVHEFAAAVGRCPETIYDYWIPKGLPIIEFKPGSIKIKKLIDLDKFWDWAYENKGFIDFTKIESGILGEEPEWTAEARKLDYNSPGKSGWCRPWTDKEDLQLKNLLKTFRYSYSDLGKMLNRSELAIQRRLTEIGEKLRPISADRQEWTDEDRKTLLYLKEKGYKMGEIARHMNRSELAIKAQIIRLRMKGVTKVKGCAFLMEMGTGKTLSAIAVMGRLFLEGKIKKLLIACPTSILFVWKKELEQFADFPFICEILSGKVENRKKVLKQFDMLPSKVLKVAVINYESTWRMEEELKSWIPDAIICDESQRIKSPSAEQSKTMHRLGKVAQYKLILTGTPVQNNPLDFFSQYKFLDESVFGGSFYSFKSRYAIMGGYGQHQIMGYQHQDELVQKSHSIAFRCTKEEALDLPEQIDQTQYIDLEPSAQKIYKNLSNECITALEGGGEVTATNILTQLLRLQQVTGGFLGDDTGTVQQVSKAKTDALKDIIDDVVVGSGKKLVIFARFLPEIKEINKILDKYDFDHCFIAGEVKQQIRGEYVEAFQNNPSMKVIVCQIQTAGLGITLTAADTAVFYSLDFNFANYSQARARTHRIGQKNNCTYIHLIVPRTVDEKIMEALTRKEECAKSVVDNWRDYFV